MPDTQQKFFLWQGEAVRCVDLGALKLSPDDLRHLVYGPRKGRLDAPALSYQEAKDRLRRVWELLDSALQYWHDADAAMLAWALEEAHALEADLVERTAAQAVAAYMGLERQTVAVWASRAR